MHNKLLIIIIITIQTVALCQWDDPAYSKINLSEQANERYRLMDKMSINLKNYLPHSNSTTIFPISFKYSQEFYF